MFMVGGWEDSKTPAVGQAKARQRRAHDFIVIWYARGHGAGAPLHLQLAVGDLCV
jgi:hypothetical protein